MDECRSARRFWQLKTWSAFIPPMIALITGSYTALVKRGYKVGAMLLDAVRGFLSPAPEYL